MDPGRRSAGTAPRLTDAAPPSRQRAARFRTIPAMLPTPTLPRDAASAGATSGPTLASLFSAVTSAMQPARIPLALLVALFIAALAPVVDLAGGSRYGPRGFAGGALSESDLRLDEQRARSAARRFAGPELAAIESPATPGEGTDTGGGAPTARVATMSELADAVRQATARRIADAKAAGEGVSADFTESEVRRIRQAAAGAMRQIEDADPRGVATVFLENERLAVKQTVNAILKLDPEGFLTGILSAVFTVPAAAIRAEPVIFPLALVAFVAIVGIPAGGLCRMAAVHVGRGGRLSALEGSGFARARVLNLVSISVLPIALFALFAAVILAFVLLLRIPVLNVVSGILFVVPLAVALLGAILALVALAAAPLMPAAVAVEDCDAGDAITRSCALVLSRPLLWLSALAIGAVALALGSILVTGAITLALNGVNGLLGLAGGEAGGVIASGDAAMIATLSGPDRLIAMLVGFWTGLFEALGAAYAVSLAFDLATRGYLLMRSRIDGESPSTVAGYGMG